ncbi:MAG: hypothetical protein M3P98_01455 [bacterium]|nr:hypothetical protein [bacterium]
MLEAKSVFGMISKGLIVLAVMDLGIVMITMMAIMAGDQVQHIPFWDAQIRFIINAIA